MLTFPENTNNLELQKKNLEFVQREWESPTRVKIFAYLQEVFDKARSPIVVDIGSNVGVFTKKWLDEFKFSMVLSFEPDIDNYQIFWYNCKKYMDQWRLYPHLCGIFYGKSTGKVLGTGDGNPGGLIFDGVAKEHLHPHVDNLVEYDKTVAMTTLEEILYHETIKVIPGLIKIDAEGSEYNIIENSILLKMVKFLLIEFHGHNEQYLREYLIAHLPEHHCHVLTNEAYGTDHHFIAFLEKNPISKEF